MNAKAVMMILRQLADDSKRKAAIGIVVFILLSPLLLIIFIAAILCLPAEILKQYFLSLLGPQELKYIYEIRPDLVEQTTVDGYPFSLPINRTVQSRFGDTGSYTGQPIDYVTYKCNGDNIYAIGDGTVITAEPNQYGGMTVVIEQAAPEDDAYDNWELYSEYWSLSSCTVETGDDVEQGDVIGYALETDSRTSTQFFCFAIYGDSTDDRVDPLPYIGEKTFDEQNTVVFREG